MAKRNSISKNSLGMAIIIGLIIQFVLPQIKLGNFAWISTLIYLLVALYLIFIA